MSPASVLHQRILDRFREVFGEPDNTLGRDDHWSIKPGPYKLAINVLANGTAELPAIWVFDPHDKHDPVMRIGIKHMTDLEDFISRILERVERARLMDYGADGSVHQRDGHPFSSQRDGHPQHDGDGRLDGRLPPIGHVTGVYRDPKSSPLGGSSAIPSNPDRPVSPDTA